MAVSFTKLLKHRERRFAAPGRLLKHRERRFEAPGELFEAPGELFEAPGELLRSTGRGASELQPKHRESCFAKGPTGHRHGRCLYKVVSFTVFLGVELVLIKKGQTEARMKPEQSSGRIQNETRTNVA